MKNFKNPTDAEVRLDFPVVGQATRLAIHREWTNRYGKRSL
jgi:hypothetical protein